MGAYRGPSREEVLTRDISNRVAEFFDSRDQDERGKLLNSLNAKVKENSGSLVQALLRREKICNGLNGIEIEAKLNCKDEVSLNLDQRIERKWGRFIKDYTLARSAGLSHYFGTDEERFLVIQNQQGVHLKIKGGSEPYNFGIEGEEFVLRRPESLKKVIGCRGGELEGDILGFVTEMLGNSNTDVRYIGTMQKHKEDRHLLERNSGRIYTLTWGKCIRMKSGGNGKFDYDSSGPDKNKYLTQLEIEYAGYIPKFMMKGNPEDERVIVEDITSLLDSFKEEYSLNPTTLTKFEWLAKKPEVKATRKKETVSVPGLFSEV